MLLLKEALELHQTAALVVLLPGCLDKDFTSSFSFSTWRTRNHLTGRSTSNLFYTQTQFLFGLAAQKAWSIPSEAKKQEVC